MMASGEIYTYLLKERWDCGTTRGAASRRKVCKEAPSRFGSFNLSLMSFSLQRCEGLVPKIMHEFTSSFMNRPRNFLATGLCARAEMNLN